MNRYNGNTRAQRSLKQINRKAQPSLKRCPECGQEKITKGMTWCDCNPGAPFRMYSIEDSGLADRLIGSVVNKADLMKPTSSNKVSK